MDTKKLFHLKDLPWNEAWSLFKNMAGDAIKNPDLQPVAVEVAKRCAGLPILLGNIARALKDIFIQISVNKQREVSEFLDCLEAADYVSLVEVFDLKPLMNENESQE